MSFQNFTERLSKVKLPEPLPSNSIHPKIGRLCALTGAGFTFIVAMIHLCTIGVNLKFPSGNAGFASDFNRDSYRLALFSFTPHTLFDSWTPLVFAFVGMAMHVQKLRIEAICGGYLRYSVFHFMMVMFGNFPYAGGIGIIFGIFNMLMMPYFIALAVLAPYSDVSLNIMVKTGEEGSAEETNKTNATQRKYVASTSTAFVPPKGFPMISYSGSIDSNMDLERNSQINHNISNNVIGNNDNEMFHSKSDYSNRQSSDFAKNIYQNFYVKNNEETGKTEDYPSNNQTKNLSTIIEVGASSPKLEASKEQNNGMNNSHGGSNNGKEDGRRLGTQILIC